ncbi:MAG: hypothetical protein ABR607_11825 [Pyrinomonadaceae bacterium]
MRISQWNACYNSGEAVIALTCVVTSSGADISAVGLMLNTAAGATLASSYVELSTNSESVTPSLNLPSGNLDVGATVHGVVSGEANGQHFFFDEKLTIENC